jgi:hypothetical protein
MIRVESAKGKHPRKGRILEGFDTLAFVSFKPD